MKISSLGLLLLAACGSRTPDPERIGDVAWHEGRWFDAVTSYRAAGNSPQLLGKYADAAFLAGQRLEAVRAWTELGTTAPERAGEAAAGLARAAQGAERAGEPLVLARAVLGLRKLAPSWPLGRMALRLALVSDLPADEAVQVLPVALAAVSGRSAADSVLLALGLAQHKRGTCIEAVPVLESVLRRSEAADSARASATTLLADCELTLGLSALNDDRVGDAERWLDRSARRDPAGAVGRRALIGFGDARLRQGDPFSATLAWQTVASARVAPDSITILALQRLRTAESADSTVHPVAVPDRP
ncbi:MAG: hypothetical protein V4558_11590 [Gemmatimonadota bacterium]